MAVAGPGMEAYFQEFKVKIDEVYEIAKKARSLGFDPEFELEMPLAEDLAARVEKLVGPLGVAEVIRELEKDMPREELALKVAEMIVDGKFGEMDEQRVAIQAIRTALAIITEGIATAAPLEGVTHVEIKKNSDDTPYLALHFAGPIRAAGGTAAALAVLVGDFVRRKLYLSPYRATEEEVERFVEEVNLYATDIAHLQYSASENDIRLAMRNIPVEVTGEPTKRDVMVTAYRNLPRISHNFVRGGAVLALVEGVLQKAPKIMKQVSRLNIDGWNWLSETITLTPTSEEALKARPKGDKYLEEVIAGRPVFSYPDREGGFRLRYGRARNTGIAAVGIHPAAMAILDDFIAVGTQIKTERPGKGGAVAPVDSIDGPIVKLVDGSVVQINSVEKAIEIRDKIDEILFVGDILIGFGEFLENNHPLMPAGWCEEWWAKEVEKALQERKFGVDLSPYLSSPYRRPPPELAVEISQKIYVPLHPAYTYHFHDISIEELYELGHWLVSGQVEFDDSTIKSIRVQVQQTPKRVLEVLGVSHIVENGFVVIGEPALPLCKCLGLLDGLKISDEKLKATLQANPEKDIMDIVQILAGFPVRKKAPTRIGCRMGRPEKADPREMKPPPHVLFPVGLAGGATRSVIKSASAPKSLSTEVAHLECSACGAVNFTRKCQLCGATTNYSKVCPNCHRPASNDKCSACNIRTEYFDQRIVDVKILLEKALQRIGEEMPDNLKGVHGMTSAYKIPEALEKGILRAKYNLPVFKDGTVRFDATNLPLTHFIPKEIGMTVERLRELGYTQDHTGQPLENEDQIVELKVQDVILSKACAEYLLRASKFIDDLLQKFYGLPSYYNANKSSDLIGHLVIGLAPHTSVGVVARVIGFTDASVCYAHPIFHAAKRRDCDGDEDAVMLLLDGLLNFSKRFLPATRGGSMDAPLILNARVNPIEVDKEAHNMDVMSSYPLEFYEATLRSVAPVELVNLMETVERRLGSERQYESLNFSIATSDISAGPHSSRYKILETMEEKTEAQLGLARRIRAVDVRDVAERLIEHHFIPDLKGNLRKFASQQFRCTKCNSKYRRVPLTGACTKCDGKLILTVTRGGVEKYLQVAMQIAQEYEASDYTKQRLKLTQRDIKSIFESDAHRQLSIADFI